ncbi:MAG: hypothetical protein AB8C02_03760 [Halioglobus sp.]
MRTLSITLVLFQALIFAPFTQALDSTEQAYVNKLVSQNVSEIRRAAQEMMRGGVFDQEVLDVMSEVVYELYKEPPSGYIQIDALSWSTNVLGASGNARYRSLLVEVKDNAYHKKLRKFAKKNLKKLPKDEVPQYVQGSVSLKALR